jgi:hypothetical protein
MASSSWKGDLAISRVAVTAGSGLEQEGRGGRRPRGPDDSAFRPDPVIGEVRPTDARGQ